MSGAERVVATIGVMAVSLTAASTAAAAQATRLKLGFADDAAKYGAANTGTQAPSGSDGSAPADGSDPSAGAAATDEAQLSYWDEFAATGATVNRVTVMWDPARPATIPDRSFLDAGVAAATARNVEIVFNVRPVRAGALTAAPSRAVTFAAFLTKLARAYPQVQTYVVGNEPNQPRFWQPQFRGKTRVAASSYERVLASAYDALKRVRPSIQVVGGAVSSRGNDDPAAASNRSTSPIRFIHDLGVAYKRSHRKLPIMDALGFHPYPRSSTNSLARGFDWPNAGFANLARVKQAMWDAFSGTAQPTVESGLKIVIDEIGWQVGVTPSAAHAYFGTESTPVTTEANQATVYGELIRRASCDASISTLLLFPLVDEPDLDRFQSGIVRADGTRRPAFAVVKNAIARARKGCQGRATTWGHARTVAGVRPRFGVVATPRPWRQRAWGFHVTAAEEATYRAAVVRVRASAGDVRTLQGALANGRPMLLRNGTIKAGYTPYIRFERKTLPAGTYVYVVDVRATMNTARRRTFVSRVFHVEAGRRPGTTAGSSGP
jgi:hypothetical protein